MGSIPVLGAEVGRCRRENLYEPAECPHLRNPPRTPPAMVATGPPTPHDSSWGTVCGVRDFPSQRHQALSSSFPRSPHGKAWRSPGEPTPVLGFHEEASALCLPWLNPKDFAGPRGQRLSNSSCEQRTVKIRKRKPRFERRGRRAAVAKCTPSRRRPCCTWSRPLLGEGRSPALAQPVRSHRSPSPNLLQGTFCS